MNLIPCRIIMSCSAARGPLLTRYHLVKSRLFGIYLHHLHTSDEDRALHDHPWSFVTILLSGGYFEWTPGPQASRHVAHAIVCLTRTWHPCFNILYRPAEFAHRLELVRPVWTLVFRWRVRREWGFFAPGGWLHWRKYSDEFCD